MYHALGYATVMHLQAAMTFEPVCNSSLDAPSRVSI